MDRVTGAFERPEAPLLDVLPADADIITKAGKTYKGGAEKGWLENTLTPGEAREWVSEGGNIGIAHGAEVFGGRIVVLDDERDCLPEVAAGLVEHAVLAEVSSPHGGRNRFLVVSEDAYRRLRNGPGKLDHLTEEAGLDLEISTGSHSLIPPSTIEHKRCNDTKPCDGTGVDRYHWVVVNPDLDLLTETGRQTSSTRSG